MKHRLTPHINRRSFLASSMAVTGASALLPAAAQSAPKVVATEPYASLVSLADGIWAVVSTPIGADGAFHPQTVCNGGLIVGEDRIVAIDAFFQPAGAAWLQREAQRLTGRRISDVIITHFHADHSGGVAGYFDGGEGPEIFATETTRRLIIEKNAAPKPVEGEAFSAPSIKPPVLPTKVLSDEVEKTTLDLGGRSITLDHKRGHTPSDVAIHVEDAPVTFAGDLIWRDYFHNYVDAIPSDLRKSAGDLLKGDPDHMIVTGHGRIGTSRELQPYLELLDHVENHARTSHKAGVSAEKAGADYAVPKVLGDWTPFGPVYFQRAMEAWYKELSV